MFTLVHLDFFFFISSWTPPLCCTRNEILFTLCYHLLWLLNKVLLPFPIVIVVHLLSLFLWFTDKASVGILELICYNFVITFSYKSACNWYFVKVSMLPSRVYTDFVQSWNSFSFDFVYTCWCSRDLGRNQKKSAFVEIFEFSKLLSIHIILFCFW